MFVRTYAGAIVGIDAAAVTVEVNIAGGGLGMYLVGLPDSAVKESEQRIRALRLMWPAKSVRLRRSVQAMQAVRSVRTTVEEAGNRMVN